MDITISIMPAAIPSGLAREAKNTPRKNQMAATVPGALLASSMATRLSSFAPIRQNNPPTMILDMIGTPRTHPRFVADERKSERNFGTALVAVMRPYASAIKSGLDIAAHSITLWAINLHAAGKKKAAPALRYNILKAFL